MAYISYFIGTKGDYVQVAGDDKFAPAMEKMGWHQSANDLPDEQPKTGSKTDAKQAAK